MDKEAILERLRTVAVTASKNATEAIQSNNWDELRILVNDMKGDLQHIEDELDANILGG
jgi:hypothetical protein